MRDDDEEVTLRKAVSLSSKSNAMQDFEISLQDREGAAMNEAPRSSSGSDRRVAPADVLQPDSGGTNDISTNDVSAADIPGDELAAERARNGYDTGSDAGGLEVAARDDRRIGQVVDGKYHVLRRLACGGMGSVYEARHVVVGRHVALKFLHEQYAQRSCMVQRFLREAQAAGGIASEHIIGVLDYGTTDGTPYLVMELVRGQDLREILGETPRLAPTRAVRIVLDACRGLSLAHERGLIHRDLKPANICVTRRSDGREVAKVIDFGVAKLRDGAELSEEGTLIGTLGYMAPEQLTDQKELDARADIYALGVILYQALSGRPPHLCNRSELLYRIVSVDPRPLHELCPELPRRLTAIVHKALCRNKQRRYANVQEFARALEPFAGDDTATAPSLFERTEDLGRARDVELDPAVAHTGTEETDLGHAPTWAALARTNNLKADRQCDGVHAPRGARGSVEDYCRHPDGVPAPPLPPRHQNLSQRALVLSVGALALSVVAMTTMFIFVYSHGSGALEAAAKASSRTARAVAEAHAPATTNPSAAAHPSAANPSVRGNSSAGVKAPPALNPPEAARSEAGSTAAATPSASPFAVTTPPDRCVVPGRPLHPASVLEFDEKDESGIRVERHALTPSGARAIECE
jgi:serine/threonine protein kinase